MHFSPKNIIISRTNNIGDVIATFPMSSILKQRYPDCKIQYLAREYVRDLVLSCDTVDGFISWDALQHLSVREIAQHLKADMILHCVPKAKISRAAKLAKIPYRLGTVRRYYHWRDCNKLVNMRRKPDDLHEAQYCLRLLRPLNLNPSLTIDELGRLISLTVPPVDKSISQLIDRSRYTLILHPGTNGHTKEWPIENFIQLIKQLPPQQYQIILTGSQQEQQKYHTQLQPIADQVCNVMGQYSLKAFMQLIQLSDGLLANGTGPLHLAAALGRDAFGLYPPCHDKSPQRWAALGPKPHAMVGQINCHNCRDKSELRCIKSISVDRVSQLIQTIRSQVSA